MEASYDDASALEDLGTDDAARCAKGGFPGSTITVPNTSYEIYTSCSNSTTHDLKQAVNQVWGKV